MSHVLKRVFHAPVGCPWQDWIHLFSDIDTVQQQLDACIGSCFLSRDVINLIVAHMFTPGLIDDDTFQHPACWFEKWLENVEWQEQNPLRLPSHHDNVPDGLDSLACICQIEPRTCSICAGRFDAIATIVDHHGLDMVNSARSMDLIVGVIDDPNGIEYVINGEHFPFLPQCKAKMQDAHGKWITFFYNPTVPVIPVHMLLGTRTQIDLSRPVRLVGVIVNSNLVDFRHDIVFKSHMVENAQFIRK